VAAPQGSGKQARGALVNLVAFYMVGMPLALTLAFPLRLGAAGLLLGLLAASPAPVLPSWAASALGFRTARRRSACPLASVHAPAAGAKLEVRTGRQHCARRCSREELFAPAAVGQAAVATTCQRRHSQQAPLHGNAR